MFSRIYGQPTSVCLVRAFTGGDSGDLGVAVALHAEVTAAGRKVNTNASMQLSTSLLKRRRLHEAAEVLLQMALKDRRRSPGYVLSMVAQRHRDENQTFYDVVGVDGSDVTLLKVRREDLAPTKDNMLQREMEIGENVACLYPHAGRYRLTCKAPGLRLCGPLLRTFSARDFCEKGPLQLTLRLEPSVARLRLALSLIHI